MRPPPTVPGGMRTRGPPAHCRELHRTTHDGRAYRSQRSRVELLHWRWQPAICLHPGESREASQWTTLIHQLGEGRSEGDRLPAPALAIDLREDHGWRSRLAAPCLLAPPLSAPRACPHQRPVVPHPPLRNHGQRHRNDPAALPCRRCPRHHRDIAQRPYQGQLVGGNNGSWACPPTPTE